MPAAGEGGGATAMVFSGNVSTDNSGGFASVRSLNYDPPLDLSAYEGVSLRLKVCDVAGWWHAAHAPV